MKRIVVAAPALLALGSCAERTTRRTSICSASSASAAPNMAPAPTSPRPKASAGSSPTLINRFNAENPDIHVDVNVVAWPGYPQLTAQMAARDPPDLVTMHEGVISDYAAEADCSSRSIPICAQAGISPDELHRCERGRA